MPRVSGVSGSRLTTMSAAGRTAGSSAIVRAPGRGRRAIRMTRAPNGARRASTAPPIEPAPSSTTDAPTRSEPVRASSRQCAVRCPSTCSGKPALRREDDHEDPLGDGDVVDAGRVAQDHPIGDAPDHPIDAGGERLDDSQAVDVVGVRDGPLGVVARR